jgi:homocitrate synthase
LLQVRFFPMIEIFDTTLRDGLQSPLWDDFEKFYPTTKEKLLLVEALARYGIKAIEVFSPIVSKREEEDLVAILEKRDQLRKELKKPLNIFVHVRCHPKDVEMALKYPVDGLNFYMGTSEQSRSSNHGKSLEEIISLAQNIIGDVRKRYPDLPLMFSGEDAFRTPVKDLFEVYDSLADLVDRFGLPDTVGAATPEAVAQRVTLLKKRYPKVALEGHFHNDRGLALINTLSAIKAGMDCVSTSILGLAERSGMTSLTALLFNLYLDDPKLVLSYDIASSYSLNVLMAGILKIQVPSCEPVSLTNRTHSAGVHTGAVLKNPSVYEGYGLESFGVTERRLLLGPLSGKHVIKYYLTEVLNYLGVTDEIAEEIIAEFKVKATHLKKRQTPTSLLEQLAEQHKLTRKDKPVAHVEVLSDRQKV